MSNDERPESLAAQAAAWVPPWERPRSEPDRDYQAAHRADGTDPSDPDGTDFDGTISDGTDRDDAEFGGVEAREGGSDGDGSYRGGFDGVGRAGEGDVERVEAGVEAEVRAEEPAELEGADYDARPGELRPDDDEERSGAGLSDDDDDFDGAFEGGNPPGYEVSPPGEAVVDEPHELPGEDGPEPTEVHLGGEVPLPGAVEEAAGAGEDEGGAPVDAPLPADGDDAGDVFDAAADDDVSDDDEVDLPVVEVVPATDADEEAALAADEAEFRLGDEASAYSAGAVDALDALRGGAGPATAEDGSDGAGLHGRPAGEDGRDGAGLDGRPAAESGLGGARLDSWPAAGEDGLGGAGLDGRAAAGADGRGGAGPDGRAAAGADGLGGAGLDVSAAAELGGDGGRAEAGSAVPAQGGRRRISPGVTGEGASRTSSGGEMAGGGAAAGVSVATPASDAEADRAAGAAALPELEDDAELASALEAIMLVVDEPVGELQLAEILEQPAERIARTLDDLSARYTAAGHGFDLRRAAGGWRLYTRPEYAGYVERFVLDGQSVRLTQAALETVAVVAYKQPVTRSRISAIRGVNCDGVMRTLVTRGLIEECGTEGETGAHLYRTTALFLEKLGLNSVDQLPPLAPFLPDDVEEVLDATG